MPSLQEAIQGYIELRKTLGYDYRVESGILRRFGAYALAHRQNHITTALVIQWAEQLGVAESTAARAVSVVRTFAAWYGSEDVRTEVPPKRLLRGKPRRRRPFLHTDEQLLAVLEASRALHSQNGMRGLSYFTVFALIAATGLRISEAINLNRADVDLKHGILTIIRSKFKKSRLIPVHTTTANALAHYAKRRDAVLPLCHDPAFFVSHVGKRLTDCSLRNGFAVASRRVGQRPTQLGNAKRGRGPRVHDLRHRFAVRPLLDWYREGKDVEREMPKLVTYLGHSDIAKTHWYIEAVPELLELASQRATAAGGGVRS